MSINGMGEVRWSADKNRVVRYLDMKKTEFEKLNLWDDCDGIEMTLAALHFGVLPPEEVE